MSRSLQKTILEVITYTLLIFGALTMLVPFLWMISVSLREPAAQFSRNIIPNPFTLQNYVDLFEDLPDQAFFYLTLNSFKLSILAVIGQVLTCAMAAFVFPIVKFKGRPKSHADYISRVIQENLRRMSGGPTSPVTTSQQAPLASPDDPLQVLKLRFARGDITKEQFEEMKKALE